MKQGTKFLFFGRVGKRIIFLSFLYLSFSNFCNAATATLSVNDGWTDSGASWSGGSGASGAPGAADNIIINTGITLTANSAFTTTGTLTLNGTAQLDLNGFNISVGSINDDAAGASTIKNGGVAATLTTTDATSPTYTGVITGAVALTKNGAGILTLSGANSYTGATTIGAGKIKLGAADVIPDVSAVIVTGSFDLNGFSETVGSLAGAGTIFNGGAGTPTLTTGADNTNTTFSGPIGAGGTSVAITKSGTGIWTVSNSNTYTGLTTISAGVLKLGSAGGATNTPLGTVGSGTTITAGAALDMNGFSLGTAEPLTLNGTGLGSNGALTNSAVGAATWKGAITLGSASSIASSGGAISINIGITGGGNDLTLGGTSGGNMTNAASNMTGVGTLYLTGSGTWTIGGSCCTSFTALDIASGAHFFDNSTLTIPNTATVAVHGTGILECSVAEVFADLTGDGIVEVTGGAARIITTTVAGNATFSGTLTESGAGSQLTLAKAGAGTLTLSGNNSYSGGTTLSAGTLNINSNTALGTGAFTISGGTIDNTSGGAITLTNNNTQSWSGNFTFTGTNNLNLGTGAVTLSAARTVTGSANILTVGGAISGAFALTKGGAGTLNLSGNNTYTGSTTITLGTLQLGAAGVIPDASAVSITGTLDMNGFSETVGSITGGGIVDNVSGGGTPMLTTGSAGATTFSGVIKNTTGILSITKVGATAFTLSGANTYSGGTTLSAGTLNINNATALGDGTGIFSIASGTTINNSTAGAITLSNNNPQIWNGDFTFTGTKSLDMGTGAVTMAANTQITSSTAANTLTEGGAISGAFNLSKAGAGKLTLSGANTYSGSTTLSAGTLNINNATALGDGTGAFSIASGTTIDNSTAGAITLTNNNPQNWNGNFTFTGTQNLNMGTGAVTMTANTQITTTASTLTQGGAIGGAFLLTKVGATGALTLSGANTYSGGTTLTSGTININNNAALGTGVFTITTGTIDNTSAGLVTLTNNNTQSWNGNFTFTGTQNLNMGTGAVTLSAARTVTGSANTLTVGGAIGGAFVLTKAGAGTLVLNGNSAYTNTSITAGTLILSGSSNAYTGTTSITGGTLQVGASGGIPSTSAVTITSPGILDLNGFNTTVGSITSSGTIDNVSAGGNVTLTCGGNNSTTTFSGIIQNTTGTLNLTKTGTGALTLTGANTHSGGVTLTTGSILIGNNAALGAPAGIFSIGSGTTINTSGGAIAIANNNPQTWNGNFTFTGTNNLNMGTGAVTMTANTQITGSANTLTQGGVISGAFNLTKAGAGVLVLNGANNYSGTTTLNAGTLDINNATALGTGAFTIAGGTIDNTSGGTITLTNNNTQNWNGNFTFTGTNNLNMGTGAVTLSANRTVTGSANTLTVGGAIAGAFNLIKTGAGTLNLSGNNTYTGSTTITLGTLQLGAAGVIPDASAVSITGTLDMNGFSETVGSITGGGIVDNVSGGGTPMLTTGSAGATTFSGVIKNTTGILSITKVGATAFTLSGANTYSGGTTLSAGTLNINNATALGDGTGIFSIASGTTINNSTAGAITLSNNNPQIWNGDFTFTGTKSLDMGTGAVTMAANTQITSSTAANTLTEGGAISGAFNLSKAGAGKLTLSGANTYSGSTTLSAGTLNINNATALGTGGFTIAGGIIDNTSGGSITLTNNNPQNWNGNFTFTGTNNLNLGTGAVTLGAARTVTGSAGVLTVGGAIGGAFALTKAGAGTLILSGNSAYTNTSITAGTLILSGSANAYTGTTSITGGTLQLGASGGIPSTSAVTITSPGIFDLNGYNSTVGSIVSSGTIDNVSAGGNVTLTCGGNNSTTTFSGIIQNTTGTLNLTKTGTGVLTLSGANTYSGATTVNGGTLKLGSSGVIPDASDVTVTSPGIFDMNTFSETIGSLAGTGTVNNVAGGGSPILTCGGNNASTIFSGAIKNSTGTLNITKTGTGALTLSGANTHTGGVILSSGTLNINNATALGATAGAFTITNGTIDNTSGGPLTITNNNAQNWNGDFTFTGTNNLNLGTGAVTMSASRQVTASGGTLTVLGIINNNAQNLTKVGTGTLAFGSQTITLNSLTISAGELTSTSGTFNLAGNFSNSGTFTHNSGTVIFNGIANQTIGTSGTQAFYNLTINNTGVSGSDKVTLSTPITVANQLTLTDGILNTDATNLITLTNNATTATNDGNSTGPSFVNGPIRWNGLNTDGPYIFPTGAGSTKWARVAVSGVTSATDFTAQYFNSAYTNHSTADLSTVVTPTLTTLSGIEYWDVDRTSGTGMASVTLYWENATASGITDCSYLRVAHYTSGKWQNEGQLSASGLCTGNNSGSITGGVQSVFSPETFGGTPWGGADAGVDPLPIELLYFNAVFNGKTIGLTWATASEINNDYFTVERSSDGINFISVEKIISQASGGNSSSVLTYTGNDFYNVSGTYYYRLKQTDFDGKYAYSSIKEVTISGSDAFAYKINVVPNPNNGKQINILLNTAVSTNIILSIKDILGKTVYTQTISTEDQNNSNNYPVTLETPLPAGVYIVNVATEDGKTSYQKMVVN